MIVYRDPERTVDPRALLQRQAAEVHAQLARPFPDHAATVALLIEFCELESAFADRLQPSADEDRPETRLLRDVAVSLGHLFRCSWQREPPPARLADLADVIATLWARLPELGRALRVKVPEGFAFYGLLPESYIAAARQFVRDHGPCPVLCIGLRSIGTALSAVVTATLQAAGCVVQSLTLRPRGEPFARRPRVAPSLAQRLRDHVQDYAVIVDEGPGLSGSSFTGTAQFLLEQGYAEKKIVLFPSWTPDPGTLVSPQARTRWPRHLKYTGEFDPQWIHDPHVVPSLQTVAAGSWRDWFFPASARPPVQPRHERRKFLTFQPDPHWLRFAGLGHYGLAVAQRAQTLAQAGFIASVGPIKNGFLLQTFVPGRPLTVRECTPELLDTAACYLAFVQRTFPAAERTRADLLYEMTCINTETRLGSGARRRVEKLLHGCALDDAPAVLLDARLQPWEWILTPHGYLKTDAIDHHEDHFFPGGTDIAWDLAGFITEFALDAAGSVDLVERFVRHGGDRSVAARLPAFRVVYTAFRLGYAHLAAQATAGTAEEKPFQRLAARYGRQLRHAIVAVKRRAPAS